MPSNCTIISWKRKKEMASLLKGSKGGGGACGAVGIGTGTGAVLFSIPEGACACGAEGPMASIGPLALGAKGCVERLHPTGETTHYDLCVAGAPANHVRCASLRSGGRRLAVRKTIEYQIGALPRTPFPAAREFPSRGNEKYGEEKQRVIYFMYHSAVSPFGGERSEPITSMRIMPYDP